MSTPENTPDIDSLTLDDVLGDGVDTIGDVIDNDIDETDDIEETDDDIEDDDLNEDYEDEYDDEDVEEEYEEEDDVEDDEEYEDSIVAQVANTLGFELNDEYEDSVEGMTEFVRDVTQNAAEEQLQNLFSQFPEVQQHLDYVLNGGNSREFFQKQGSQIDFNALEIQENNVNMQRAIVAQYMQSKGIDQETIQDTLDTYEDSGRLFNNAERAKKHLADMQKQEEQQMIELQKQQYQQQQQELQEFWGEVADTIESGNEFAGIRIPDREKNNFFSYISEPVGPNGETQRDLDYSEAGVDVKLAIDYMMYSGFDLEGIIDKKARTKSARSLRDRIISNEERVKNARRSGRKSRSFNIDDVDVNRLLD